MYRYQLANKKPVILFEGPELEYLEWAEHYLENERYSGLRNKASYNR